MGTNRRGFLKLLGLGAATVATSRFGDDVLAKETERLRKEDKQPIERPPMQSKVGLHKKFSMKGHPKFDHDYAVACSGTFIAHTGGPTWGIGGSGDLPYLPIPVAEDGLPGIAAPFREGVFSGKG